MPEEMIIVSSLYNITINIIIGLISIIIMYQFARMITTKTFAEINAAFNTNIQNHEAMTDFMETTYKTSTEILSGLLTTIKIQQKEMVADHARIKEDTTEIIDMLKEQNTLIKGQQDISKGTLETMKDQFKMLQEQQVALQEQQKIITEQHELLMRHDNIP